MPRPTILSSSQLRPAALFAAFEFAEIGHYTLTRAAACAIGFDQCPVGVPLAVLLAFATPQKHLLSLIITVINNHKNRRFFKLFKRAGLHYIEFGDNKPHSPSIIAGFIPKKYFIFHLLRNLG